MRILSVSDLHSEFLGFEIAARFFDQLPPADVLVLAGDIGTDGTVGRLCRHAATSSKYAHVLYVLGNHEYYESIQSVKSSLAETEEACSNFHWLDNEIFEFGGRRFLGTPLWYPWFNWLPLRKFAGDTRIKDFEKIAFEGAREASSFLYTYLDEGDIVVSHTLPSRVCIAPRWKTSALNPFFVHDLTDLILERKPKLWIHGHTHNDVDAHIGQTRIFCNPVGYPGERGKWTARILWI